MSSAPIGRRLQMALGGYFYAYIAILLGVITAAAGLTLALGNVRAPLALEPALLLGGGIALFLVSEVAFRLALGVRPVFLRLVAASLALGTTAVSVTISGFAQLVVLVTMTAGLFVVERLWATGEP